MQDGDQDEGDRPVEVEDVADLRVGEDLCRVAQVGVDVGGASFRRGSQQRAGMGEDHRVIVRVHDPGLRSDPLRHLVHVVGGRQPGPDVEELPHSGFPGQVLHGPAEERAVLPRGDPQVGRSLEHLLREGTVGGEVALPAEQVVVDPGRVRPRRVQVQPRLLRHCRPRLIWVACA